MMKLTYSLSHFLHHVSENENEVKFHCVQNSESLATIVYDNKPICHTTVVFCNGNIYGCDTCYKVIAIEEIEFIGYFAKKC